MLKDLQVVLSLVACVCVVVMVLGLADFTVKGTEANGFIIGASMVGLLLSLIGYGCCRLFRG